MNRTDRIFLTLVAICTVALLVLAADALNPAPVPPVSISRPPAATGVPRTVNLLQLQRRLQRGELSRHEALYYDPVTSATSAAPR